MTEFKGTQGPWEAQHVVSAGWSVRKADERPGYTGKAPICSMAWFQFPIEGIITDEISEANARLIAAAPELLRSLKSLSDMYVHCFDTTDGGGYMSPKSVERFEAEHKKAVDAIAKALGDV